MDVAGGIPGSFGKTANLVRHHGKATPVLSRTGCLDGCVQSKKIGLICDVFNNLCGLGDLLGLR